MSYASPSVPLIENPINLDACLQSIQIALKAKLSWLDYSFGRATIGERVVDGTTRPKTYPQAYAGKGQYVSVEPNNHYAAHSFMQLAGPEKPVEFDRFQRNIYTAEVEVVFLFDLDKINAKREIQYSHRFTEELKDDIKKAFRSMPEVKTVEAIYETPAEVFKGYSYNHLLHQTFKHPSGGFKFLISVSYLENC